MHCLETYLQDLRQIRATGANLPETSYYPALSNLFNEVGKQLKPKVRCVINITSKDPGIPDGGLFTAHQFRKRSDPKPKTGQLPARGAIEVKGTDTNVNKVAQTKQVKKYVDTYGRCVTAGNWDSYRQA